MVWNLMVTSLNGINGNISVLLALRAGNSPVTGDFPSQRPVTRIFDVFFDPHLNRQSRNRWYEIPSRALWRHCNLLRPSDIIYYDGICLALFTEISFFQGGIQPLPEFMLTSCEFVPWQQTSGKLESEYRSSLSRKWISNVRLRFVDHFIRVLVWSGFWH